MVEIALGTAEAIGAKEAYGTYETRLGWVAIDWREGGGMGLYGGLDYDIVAGGKPDNIPQSAEWYSQVEITFGEPPRVLLRVAINPDSGKVAHIESHGLKVLPD